MNVDCQSRVQELAELVRSGEYRVDPTAVAAAVVTRIAWDDVPQLSPATAEPLRASRSSRLRMLIPVGRLVSAPMPPRAPLSA
jgi:hypothetical protein